MGRIWYPECRHGVFGVVPRIVSDDGFDVFGVHRRFPAYDPKETFQRGRRGGHRGFRQMQNRRGASREAREQIVKLSEGHVLAAQDVPSSRLPLCQRRNVPGGDLGDMGDRNAAIEQKPLSLLHRLEDQPVRRRELRIVRAHHPRGVHDAHVPARCLCLPRQALRSSLAAHIRAFGGSSGVPLVQEFVRVRAAAQDDDRRRVHHGGHPRQPGSFEHGGRQSRRGTLHPLRFGLRGRVRRRQVEQRFHARQRRETRLRREKIDEVGPRSEPLQPAREDVRSAQQQSQLVSLLPQEVRDMVTDVAGGAGESDLH